MTICKCFVSIGIVGQEPVLFGCSIADNVRYGRDNVTDKEIEQACKEANAWGFVQRLPKVISFYSLPFKFNHGNKELNH